MRATLTGTAYTVNGLASLKFVLDTSILIPGNYTLSVPEPGLDGWSDYAIALR